MGLDQYLLRGKYDNISINQETGDWVNAEELMCFNKSYWLQNKMMDIGLNKKIGNTETELNTVFIPLTKDELRNIVKESKEVVQYKSEELLEKYFDIEIFDSKEFNDILTEMKNFNQDLSRYLRNNKLTNYWYWSWW